MRFSGIVEWVNGLLFSLKKLSVKQQCSGKTMSVLRLNDTPISCEPSGWK